MVEQGSKFLNTLEDSNNKRGSIPGGRRGTEFIFSDKRSNRSKDTMNADIFRNAVLHHVASASSLNHGNR